MLKHTIQQSSNSSNSDRSKHSNNNYNSNPNRKYYMQGNSYDGTNSTTRIVEPEYQNTSRTTTTSSEYRDASRNIAPQTTTSAQSSGETSGVGTIESNNNNSSRLIDVSNVDSRQNISSSYSQICSPAQNGEWNRGGGVENHGDCSSSRIYSTNHQRLGGDLYSRVNSPGSRDYNRSAIGSRSDFRRCDFANSSYYDHRMHHPHSPSRASRVNTPSAAVMDFHRDARVNKSVRSLENVCGGGADYHFGNHRESQWSRVRSTDTLKMSANKNAAYLNNSYAGTNTNFASNSYIAGQRLNQTDLFVDVGKNNHHIPNISHRVDMLHQTYPNQNSGGSHTRSSDQSANLSRLSNQPDATIGGCNGPIKSIANGGLHLSKYSVPGETGTNDLIKDSNNNNNNGDMGAKLFDNGVKEILTSLGLLCLISLLLALLSLIFLLKISPVTATDMKELLRAEQFTIISPDEYVTVYEVTLALCALSLSLNLCCLLVCSVQFLFAVKLARSSINGDRTNKYLQKSSITRVCATAGFFVSIPVFLTGVILYTFIQFHSTPAIITSSLIGSGIVFCGCAMVHNVFVWQKEKTKAVRTLLRRQKLQLQASNNFKCDGSGTRDTSATALTNITSLPNAAVDLSSLGSTPHELSTLV